MSDICNFAVVIRRTVQYCNTAWLKVSSAMTDDAFSSTLTLRKMQKIQVISCRTVPWWCVFFPQYQCSIVFVSYCTDKCAGLIKSDILWLWAMKAFPTLNVNLMFSHPHLWQNIILWPKTAGVCNQILECKEIDASTLINHAVDLKRPERCLKSGYMERFCYF